MQMLNCTILCPGKGETFLYQPQNQRNRKVEIQINESQNTQHTHTKRENDKVEEDINENGESIRRYSVFSRADGCGPIGLGTA